MSDSPSERAAIKVATKKPRQGRSPAFPFIPINKAIDRAEVFRVAEGGRPKHFSPVNSAFAAWKLGPKTGPALQTIAAMGHYGLFEFQGSGSTRSARLTDLAFKILLDKQPTSPERDALIAQAALTPAIHAELWAKWQDSLPSDPTLETYLVRDRGFSETGARDLIAEYKATMGFAKLGQSGIIPSVDDGGQVEESPPVEIVVGDLVQVEIGGVLQLAKPARVRAVQDHQGQTWAFIEGSEAGVPMEQVILEAKGEIPPLLTPPLLAEVNAGVRPSGDEREWLRGPLSKETSYRLIVAGDLGPKEIGKLIKLLKAQQSVLSDDDGEEVEDV